MPVSEDVWDRISKLDLFKDGRYVGDEFKNTLRSFAFYEIDLYLKEYHIDRTKIKILN